MNIDLVSKDGKFFRQISEDETVIAIAAAFASLGAFTQTDEIAKLFGGGPGGLWAVIASGLLATTIFAIVILDAIIKFVKVRRYNLDHS